MKKIGLTGNMGSGKSTVSLIFKAMGVPVFNADSEAKKLYADEDVKKKVEKLFGKSVITAANTVDFKKLANLIFNDTSALKTINGLIHPLTLTKFEQWLKQNENAPYIIHESAIIFENRLQGNFDKIINVSAPEETRIARICKRDSLDQDLIGERMKNQMTDEEKARLSDFVIINDGEEFLIPQILKINNLILKK